MSRLFTPEQLANVAHRDGPLYCGAVAGCGKTAAAIGRVAQLVSSGVPGERILGVTFSKKAADEMNERLDAEYNIDSARLGTWHSLALQILKEDQLPCSAWAIDLKDRNKTFVKEVLGYRYLDWKGSDPRKVGSYIGWCKAYLWSCDSEEALAEAVARFGSSARDARRAYQLSDELTHGAGLLTFDDMLVFCARHLAVEENARRWSARWDYVIQDEAQDASPVQMAIAEALTRHGNYMVVGDIAQSIYGFRGSSPLLLKQFPETHAGTTTVYMNRNYRSARAIVAAANAAIRPAEVRLPVEMVGERDLEGSASARAATDLDDEARQFVDHVKVVAAGGERYASVTCLYRTNAQSRALEEQLLREKIPYVVVGGGCFYERKEVRDLLAYLRVAADQDPDGDAVRRCVNAPFRFLGKAFVDRLMRHQQEAKDIDWTEAVRAIAGQAGIQKRQQASAFEWSRIVDDLRGMLNEPADKVLLNVVQRTNYTQWVQQDEGEDNIENSGAANVRELVRVAASFATVGELLEYVDRNIRESAQQRKRKTGDRVLLMSIHRSKGLEWPHVWVVGCNDGILPHGKGDPEEERRLFYVALTRARDSVVCSYVASFANATGVRKAHPSSFLDDAGLTVTRVTASAEDELPLRDRVFLAGGSIPGRTVYP